MSNQSTSLTLSLPLKNDSTTSNGHNQQANNDVSITTVQSSYQQQQPMPPAKPEISLAFSQQHDAALEQSWEQSSIFSKVTADNLITDSIII